MEGEIHIFHVFQLKGCMEIPTNGVKSVKDGSSGSRSRFNLRLSAIMYKFTWVINLRTLTTHVLYIFMYKFTCKIYNWAF